MRKKTSKKWEKKIRYFRIIYVFWLWAKGWSALRVTLSVCLVSMYCNCSILRYFRRCLWYGLLGLRLQSCCLCGCDPCRDSIGLKPISVLFSSLEHDFALPNFQTSVKCIGRMKFHSQFSFNLKASVIFVRFYIFHCRPIGRSKYWVGGVLVMWGA